MAGIEVAGVILGSIPLVIAALEHYGNGVAVMKNMRDFEGVFDDFHTQLEVSVGIYMNSCYQLLGPLDLTDDQMSELLEQRKVEAWSDPKLQQGIESRLGDNYKRYVSAVRNLDKRISLFCRKLKLNEDMKPPWIGPDSTIDLKARKRFFSSTWTRIRGGFDASKYAALLQDIDRDVDKIAKLTSGSIQLEPLRNEKKNRLQSLYWQNIRDQAQRLFESLSSRFAPCACSHPHKANLRLDVRRQRGEDDDTTRFAFLLTFEKSTCGPTSLPWDWRDVEIECSQYASTEVSVSSNPSTQASVYPRETAHFAPSITVSSPTQTAPRSASPATAAKIENLCKALVDGFQSECCLGVLDDQPWKHHVYSVAGPGSKHMISEAASLEEMIAGKTSISLRQKCTLALTLASSVLTLNNTKWLPEIWDTKDILVLMGHSGTPIPSHFYVSQTFKSTAAEQAANRRRRFVKNEMVFALGVALLELAYGAPILSFMELQDLNDDGKEDSMTKVSIATRLARQLNENESENFAKAVQRCIICNFDTFSFDFENKEFREKFYEGVVVPLQEDYEHVTGTRIA